MITDKIGIDIGKATYDAQHLSVQAYCPEWRKGQAQPHELDDAPEAAGEPRGLAARHLFGLIG
jgi:hypothetical protein